MRALRFVIPFGVVLLEAGSASATVSSVTVTTTGVTRQTTSGAIYECPGRGAGGGDSSAVGCVVEGKYQGVGFRDCNDDTDIVFPVQVAGLPDTQSHMEIWAGTGDCTQVGQTHNASTGVCWKVAPDPVAQLVMTISLRVQDIVGQLGISPPVQTYQQAPASVCTTAASATTTTTTTDSGTSTSSSGEATINLYFMFFSNSSTGAPVVSSAAYPVKVKLSGPAACSNVTSGTGDGVLIVGWTPPTGDTTIQGYNIYAVPTGQTNSEGGTVTICSDASQGTELFDDAGNVIRDDAGNPIFVDDAGNPVSQDAGCYTQYVPPNTNTCSGTIDVSGVSCPGSECTQVNGPTNAQGTIGGLTNGTAYDVAVAAFDQFGNTGSVSGAVCGTPAPINDFWKLYEQGGGNAFCALDVVGKPAGSVAAALVGIVGIILMRRRRSSRS